LLRFSLGLINVSATIIGIGGGKDLLSFLVYPPDRSRLFHEYFCVQCSVTVYDVPKMTCGVHWNTIPACM